ncbi:MAG: hypothetical protein ACD_54C00452G0002 [uncultured bacterium]|nr:MAG: hypothetical protein ACD_54C00452G0002 [uncultured bacterium]
MRLEIRVTGCGSAACNALLRHAATDNLRICRFGQDDPRLRPFTAQHTGNPGHRAPGAIAGHQVVKPVASKVGDNLARCRCLVDLGVGTGFELTGQKPAMLFSQLDSFHVHAGALLRAGRQHHLRAQYPHQPPPLDRKAVGHSDDQRITLLRADHRQPNAGIATGCLDHGLSGLQGARSFGSLDDVQRQPVLDRSRRIERFDFHIKPHSVGCEVVDPHDGCVADGIKDAVIQHAAPLGRPYSHGVHLPCPPISEQRGPMPRSLVKDTPLALPCMIGF